MSYLDVDKYSWLRIDEKDIKKHIPSGDKEFHSTWLRYENETDGQFGACYGNLCFDFDSKENIEESKKDCLDLYDDLISKHVNPKNIRIKFSGNKGFHMEIDYRSFMEKPEHNLPFIYKQLYYEIKDRVKTIDGNVYKVRSMLRWPNTIHPSSSLYAIQITREELDLSMDEIREMAKAKRELSYEFEWDEFMAKKFKSLREKYWKTQTYFEKQIYLIKDNIDGCPPCIDNMLAEPRLDNRNENIYFIVRSLKGLMEESLIIKRIEDYCIKNNYPIKEATPTIKSALRKDGGSMPSCSIMEQYCDKSLCDQMCKVEYKQDSKKVSSVFQSKKYSEAIHDLIEDTKNGKFNRAISTGIKDLDRLCIVYNEHLTVIGANSSFGKSSFLTTIIKNNPEVKISYLAIEEGMNKATSRINFSENFNNNVTIHTAKMGSVIAEDVRSLIKVYLPEVVLIDQLINMNEPDKPESERLKYKILMTKLRDMALDFKIPIFIFHQLNREAINADIPKKEQLAEGADIERLAHNVWLLFRRKVLDQGNEKLVNFLNIDKQKTNRQTIIIPLDYCMETEVYDNYSGIDEPLKQIASPEYFNKSMCAHEKPIKEPKQESPKMFPDWMNEIEKE